MEIDGMANSLTWNITVFFSSSPNQTIHVCAPYLSPTSNTEKWLIASGYIIKFLLSVVGNVLVIGAFWREKTQFASPVDSFIVNTAASDILIPLFVIPRLIQEVFLGWGPWLVDGVLGNILCKVANFADEVSVTVSSQSMVFIAAERFWAIVYPLKVPLISRESTPKWICFTWVFSCSFWLVYFFIYKLEKVGNTTYCMYSLPEIFPSTADLIKVDRMALNVVFGVVPFIFITLFYTAIVISLCRATPATIHLPSAAEKRREKEKRKTILMLIIIVVVFFISWTLHYVYIFEHYFLLDVNWSCNVNKVWYKLVLFTNYINIVVNPIIYYSFNKNYRRGFNNILYSIPSSFRAALVACCQFVLRNRVAPIESPSSEENDEGTGVS